MQPMPVIRGWQYQMMNNALLSVKHMLQEADPQALNTYRDSGDGWTVVEVLCHLRDFDELFLRRARMTMSEDYPPLPFPDPDELAAEKNYNAQDVWDVYNAWADWRGQFIAFFQNIKNEDDWERAGQHPKRGRFTLDDQLILTPWHDALHIEQMTRILAEKRG